MKILNSILLTTALCTGALYADKPEHAGHNKHNKHEKKNKKNKQHKKHKKEHKNFSSEETRQIESYYNSLPYGLQKKIRHGKDLPPGWNNKVRVGEAMPQEYIDYAEPVSNDLRIKLQVDSQTKLLQISNRIFRVEIGTNRLLGEFQF